jgi:hypothetical protein
MSAGCESSSHPASPVSTAWADQVRADAFLLHLERIASEVGRLRRRLGDGDLNCCVLDRIGDSVEVIDALVQPTAAERYRANLRYCGDEGESIEAALFDVDVRTRRLRGLLGEKSDALPSFTAHVRKAA